MIMKNTPGTVQRLVPFTVGVAGAAALVALYLVILTLLQSTEHALGQLTQDWIWVGLVAAGFGTQLGLYAYLRQIIAQMKLAGASALTGAATGTSTAGMIACCAHHLADVAPLIGLTGASGLSGMISFLGEYKVPIIVVGLLVNVVGIAFSLRTIRAQRGHLLHMVAGADAAENPAGLACHQA
jgi:hypothetical protein